jgi:hypothetical protein
MVPLGGRKIYNRFLNGSYFEDTHATNTWDSSGKTVVLPMLINHPLLASSALYCSLHTGSYLWVPLVFE